jgi:hypothetical protein
MADEISPCGLVRIEWQLSTGLMSHEINSPRFIDARSGQPFLTLWDEQWDASVRWHGEGRFRFGLRNYGRQGNLEAEVDLPARTFRLVAPPGDVMPLEAMEESVRNAFKQLEREANRAALQVAVERRRPNIWLILIVAAAILVAFLLWFG